ncbi:MFS transporter [Actinokineospora inagensis]|uniref:MFS transporter n=1 Tax=Actinokineospora inagensis TaxID=103730 RepID=UPI0004044CD5|nr:MFS transporter [Actinokineospora inagensis]
MRDRPLLALSLGYFLVMLDVTVVTVAVPDIQRSLGASPSAVQWVVDGYSTVFAALLLFGGGLGDRVGHRRVFLAGLGVFAAASVVCAAAAGPGMVVLGRLLQGVGAAAMVPTSLALVAAAHPDRERRARALGVWAGVSAVAFAAGPVVGGVLVSGPGWRAVFWVNVPVAVAAWHLTRLHVPTPENREVGRMDVVGQVLAVSGLTCLAGALNEAAYTPSTVVMAVVAVVALIGFVVRERAAENPLLPLGLFREPGFVVATAVGLLLNMGYYGMLFLSTLYFQQQRGYSALVTGFALLPTVGLALIGAPLSGRLTARHGPYRVMAGRAHPWRGWLPRLAGRGPHHAVRPAGPGAGRDRHRHADDGPRGDGGDHRVGAAG